jgi:hypothetical protein
VEHKNYPLEPPQLRSKKQMKPENHQESCIIANSTKSMMKQKKNIDQNHHRSGLKTNETKEAPRKTSSTKQIGMQYR